MVCSAKGHLGRPDLIEFICKFRLPPDETEPYKWIKKMIVQSHIEDRRVPERCPTWL